MQEAKVLTACRFAGEIKSIDVRPEVLVHFENRTRRPVGVATVRLRLETPPRVHEGNGLGDILRAEHIPQDSEDLLLGRLIVLIFYDIALRLNHSNEDNARAGQEASPSSDWNTGY